VDKQIAKPIEPSGSPIILVFPYNRYFSADRLVNLKYMESVSDELEQSVDLMRECVRIRGGQLTLPGDFCDAVNDIICFLCTD